MEILDPGHHYRLDTFDGEGETRLRFMKRYGPGYPGNTSENPGTNCQEVIRALIDRMIYVNNQIPDDRNVGVIRNLRECLWFLEERAAERHGIPLTWNATLPIEKWPTCAHCGHVACEKFEVKNGPGIIQGPDKLG